MGTLFKLGREFYLDDEYDEKGELQTSHFPDLEKDWVDPSLARDTMERRLPSAPVIEIDSDDDDDDDPYRGPAGSPNRSSTPTVPNVPPIDPTSAPTSLPPAPPPASLPTAPRQDLNQESMPMPPLPASPEVKVEPKVEFESLPPRQPTGGLDNSNESDAAQASRGDNVDPEGDDLDPGGADQDSGGAGDDAAHAPPLPEAAQAPADDGTSQAPADADGAVQAPGGAAEQHEFNGEADEGEPAVSAAGRPRRNLRTHRDGPARCQSDLAGEWVFHVDPALNDPPPAAANLGRPRRNFHPRRNVSLEYLSLRPLLQDTWEDERAYPAMPGYVIRDTEDQSLDYVFEPHTLASRTKASKYNEDNPNWDMAMNGPFSEEYWRAMETEMETLEMEMQSWELSVAPQR